MVREKRPPREPRFRVGVAAVYTFVLGAFVLPGVYGAITGAPVPAPSHMGTWTSWIVRWIAISVVGYCITAIVFRLLERRKRNR